MRKKPVKMFDFCGPVTQAVKPSKRKKTPTNSLTNKIIDFINRQDLSYAFRINTQGTYSEELGKFINSGSTKGVSDIIACYAGQLLCLEIKFGRDKLNSNQERFKEKIESAQGLFYEIRTYEAFLFIWQSLTKPPFQ